MLEVILGRPRTAKLVDLPAAPYSATHQATFAMNGRIYSVGGLNNSIRSVVSFAVYDIATNTWSSPTAFPMPTRSSVLGGLGSKLFLAGGYDQGGTNMLYNSIYDFTAGTWTKLTPTLPQAIAEMNYETFPDGMMILEGGILTGNTAYNGTLQFNLNVANLDIQTKQNVPTPAGRSGTCVVGNSMYVAGGRLATGAMTSVFLRYDRASDTWTTLAPVPVETASISLLEKAGIIYALVTNQNSVYGNFLYSYIISENRWEYNAQLPGTIHAITKGVVWNSELYLVGGYNGTTRTNAFSKLVID